MKRTLIACVFLCTFGVSSASFATAHKNKHKSNSDTGKIYLSGGAGYAFPIIARDNYIPSGPGWPVDYYSRNKINNQGLLNLGAGYAWERKSKWLPAYSVGLRYLYMPATTVRGYVDQYSLPEFENYSYTYRVQQQNILAVVKADIYRWKDLMPYLIAGAGISMTKAYQYEEHALNGVTPRVSPGFGTKVNTKFAYTAGAGFDFVANKNLWINLEYNYGNYGTISTGDGANSTSLTGSNFSNSSLKNKLTANTILAGVTYYIG